jgi:hypothetical protein
MNFAESLKTNTPPPSGIYTCAVVGEPTVINDSKRRGVRFTLEITEGPYLGRRALIQLVTHLEVGGYRPQLLNDLKVIESWRNCLGVDVVDETVTEFIAKLRDASVEKRVEFEFDCRRWRNKVDIYLVGVRLAL